MAKGRGLGRACGRGLEAAALSHPSWLPASAGFSWEDFRVHVEVADVAHPKTSKTASQDEALFFKLWEL